MNLFAILTWGMLIPLSFSSQTAMNKMTISPGLASFSLTCPELATLNTKLDSLIRYTFPAEVPGDKAYAVQGFTHSYKFLINSMHHSDCAAEAEKGVAEMESVPMHMPMSMSAKERDDVEDYIMQHLHGMNVKRQVDQTTMIICLVIDALLEGTGSGSNAATTAAPPASKLVGRQDTGIVQQLLTLLGQILDVVLGCDDSGSG